MPINSESLNRKLYDLLSTRGYDPKPLDVEGKVTPVPEEAAVIKFDFIKDEENYGKVWASIDGSKTLQLYYGDGVSSSPDDPTKNVAYDDTWTGLLKHLKNWSQRRQLGFELRNENHLVSDMARRKHTENLGENMNKLTSTKVNESYYPMGKQGSYSDAVPTTKIILQHTRKIEEGEQRYRNIAKIFVENMNGERFLIPTIKPGIARVYARHISEGGTPYDERGKHITSLVEEYKQMAGFVRATKNKQFNESAQSLINEGINHYQSLRESLHKMCGRRGYTAYFENWQPTLIEDEEEQTNLNELFVLETLDPRIETVMPILSRLHKHIPEMKETTDLVEWTDGIIDETLNVQEENIPIRDKEDLRARRKAIQDILMDPETAKDPLLKREVMKRKHEIEAEATGLEEMDVAEGLEDSTIQTAIIDTVERLFRKNNLSDYGALEAVRQGVKHHFSKPNATVETAIEGILNILNKRMRKGVELGRFKEALRQGIAHQLKKQGVAEGSGDKVHLKTPKHGLADHPGRNTGVGLRTFAATPEQDRCPKCNSLFKNHYQKEGVAEGGDKDTLTQAVNLYREFSKKYPHKIAVDKSAKAHDLDPNKLNNYIDHGKYRATAKSDQGVAEGGDISGLLAASHLNKSFIITAELAEGGTKKYRVKAQSERVAKEKFMKHHSMAKIVDVKEEGVSEDLDANQKRAGQLGPTEPIGKDGGVGKLVGVSESNTLESIISLAGIKRLVKKQRL
jgi:hypothetical protein